jgi:DNA-binding transcriptional ArsR family regulator
MSQQAVCLLCGALVSRASPRDGGARSVCAGCAERLEVELSISEAAVCPECGRHRELCTLMPCGHLPAHATPARAQRGVVVRLQRRHVSGAERVRAIESLAATRLGVRELSRRTGLAPSTISRWLKIDRLPPLKRALASDALDIGRAKLLADAPETALAELIQLAPGLPRADLARRVAALRPRLVAST